MDHPQFDQKLVSQVLTIPSQIDGFGGVFILPHDKPITYPEQDKAWPCVLRHVKKHSSSSSAGWIGASCRSLAAGPGFLNHPL